MQGECGEWAVERRKIQREVGGGAVGGECEGTERAERGQGEGGERAMRGQ